MPLLLPRVVELIVHDALLPRVAEVGFAFRVEGIDALAGLGRLVEEAERLHAELADAADVFGAGIEGALGDRNSSGALLEDFLAPFFDFRVQLVQGNHDVA